MLRLHSQFSISTCCVLLSPILLLAEEICITDFLFSTEQYFTEVVAEADRLMFLFLFVLSVSDNNFISELRYL